MLPNAESMQKLSHSSCKVHKQKCSIIVKVGHQREGRTCDVAGTERRLCHAGAHNTIVTSRAGKDLVSCLVSGLLTIGPRFGGAIDDAARFFQVWLRGWS